MSENILTLQEPVQPPERKATTLDARFNGFAAAHLSLSALVLLAIMVLPRLTTMTTKTALWNWFEEGVPLVVALLMGIYFPLGMLVARVKKWTAPQTRRERVLAVLRPAAVAWVWALVVLVTVWLNVLGVVEMRPELFMALLTLSFLFASPSSYVMLFSFAVDWPSSVAGKVIFLNLQGFLVGLLPPLLFALGSFWQAKRQMTDEEKGT